MSSEEEQFNKGDGEALEIGDDFDSEEDNEDAGEGNVAADAMR